MSDLLDVHAQRSGLTGLRELPKARRAVLFYSIWALSAACLGWRVMQGQLDFDSAMTLFVLVVLMICTAALLWWLARPAPDMPADTVRTRRGWFALVLAAVTVAVFVLQTLIGRAMVFVLPVLGLIVLAVLRPRLSRQEVVYALLLALVSCVAGLGAGWVTFTPWVWAALQVALVLPGLLAGWSLFRQAGLLQAGVGHSLLLAKGPVPALRGFAHGILMSIPWALGMIALGSASGEDWVQHWWQPLLAIEPGIAEEAWGRVLVVALLFLVFRPIARPRTALTAAVFLAAYWFAYIHTPGGIEGAISTLMFGTLYMLPISYLWLRRGLEAAIGFHFWLDLSKFVVAYLLNRGLISG